MRGAAAETCLIGMGSNRGTRGATFRRAIWRLEALAEPDSFACSRWFRTAPVGGPSGQEWFLNAAASFRTPLPPEELLDVLQEIETELGRTRGEPWSARTLDLDLLLYGEAIVRTPRLAAPHPRLAYRRFALVPACDVAGDRLHPELGRTLRDLLADLDRRPPAVAFASLEADSTNRFLKTLAEAWGCETVPAAGGDGAAKFAAAQEAWSKAVGGTEAAAQPLRPRLAGGDWLPWLQAWTEGETAPLNAAGPSNFAPRLVVVPHPEWEAEVEPSLRRRRDDYVRSHARSAVLWLGRGKEPFPPLDELAAAWEGIVGPAVPIEPSEVP